MFPVVTMRVGDKLTVRYPGSFTYTRYNKDGLTSGLTSGGDTIATYTSGTQTFTGAGVGQLLIKVTGTDDNMAKAPVIREFKVVVVADNAWTDLNQSNDVAIVDMGKLFYFARKDV